MQKNLYTNTARFYDKGNELKNYYYDIDFYKQCTDTSTNILELGCGTGRVTLSLIDSCNHITGADLSDEMLDILQVKVDNLEVKYQKKIQLANADMSNFELNRKFDLIIFPGIAFQALSTAAQRKSCLECAKKHLTDGGRIIIDLIDSDYDKVDKVGKPRVDFEYFDEELGCTIKKHSVIENHDRENQLQYIKYTFDLIGRDNLIDSIEDAFKLSYLYEEQAKELFINCGLTINALYGWYDFSDRDKENKRMLIYVLGKNNNVL